MKRKKAKDKTATEASILAAAANKQTTWLAEKIHQIERLTGRLECLEKDLHKFKSSNCVVCTDDVRHLKDKIKALSERVEMHAQWHHSIKVEEKLATIDNHRKELQERVDSIEKAYASAEAVRIADEHVNRRIANTEEKIAEGMKQGALNRKHWFELLDKIDQRLKSHDDRLNQARDAWNEIIARMTTTAPAATWKEPVSNLTPITTVFTPVCYVCGRAASSCINGVYFCADHKETRTAATPTSTAVIERKEKT